MKKNLIFGISLVLVVLMASGVFAGLFGITGKADMEQGDIKLVVSGDVLYQGRGKTYSFEGNDYKVEVVSIGSSSAEFSLIFIQGNEATEGPSFKMIVGASKEILGLEITLVEIGKTRLWGRNYVRIRVKYVGVEEEPVEICTDSDGGLNYYVKGSVTFEDDTSVDNCFDNNILVELYCTDKGGSGHSYPCPNGCVDGACIGEEPTSEVTYEGVLKMLGGCEILGVDSKEEMDGDQACKSFGYSSCIFAQVRESSGRNLIRDCNDAPYLGNLEDGKDFLVMCCSP